MHTAGLWIEILDIWSMVTPICKNQLQSVCLHEQTTSDIAARDLHLWPGLPFEDAGTSFHHLMTC